MSGFRFDWFRFIDWKESVVLDIQSHIPTAEDKHFLQRKSIAEVTPDSEKDTSMSIIHLTMEFAFRDAAWETRDPYWLVV